MERSRSPWDYNWYDENMDAANSFYDLEKTVCLKCDPESSVLSPLLTCVDKEMEMENVHVIYDQNDLSHDDIEFNHLWGCEQYWSFTGEVADLGEVDFTNLDMLSELAGGLGFDLSDLVDGEEVGVNGEFDGSLPLTEDGSLPFSEEAFMEAIG
jgi:hypothetical protein